MRLLYVFLCLVLFTNIAQSQKQRPTFNIKRATGSIQLDGVPDELVWRDAEVISDLFQQFPNDTSRSVLKTEFRATYDDDFLYFSAVAYDNVKGGYVISSLRRDFRGAGLDGIAVILDPFQDVTNAFFFGLSPAGVQREGLIANGYLRREDLDLSWDNKWYSETKIHDGYWTVELAIPFKTLRFKGESNRWNVKLYRQDSKENERAIWPLTPRFFEPGNLNYTGEMIWDTPPKKPGSNISLIPYAKGQMSRDFQTDEPQKQTTDFGGDAKIAITSSLNLDLTINPDFSQVEVDRQVTNLDRFELFFPERRQFFLENADLFSSYGHIYAKPFFSRRLGITRDPNTGLNVQNKINFGVRLSGNINKSWRVGFLNMQTAEIKESKIPSFNNTVATLQRRIGTNSNLRAIFVNQQQFSTDSTSFRLGGYNFNRVAGLDYNYSFLNNKWTGNMFFHKQFTEQNPSNEFAHGYSLIYSSRKLSINWYHQIIGTNYTPAIGYVPRNGYKRISPSGAYFMYPKSATINNHGPTWDLAFIWDDEFGYTDHELTYGYAITFQSQATLEATYKNVYTFLFNDFDPTNSPKEDNATKILKGSAYTYGNATVSYKSDPRKLVTYEGTAVIGQYFNGTRHSVTGIFNYRFQPYGIFSVDIGYNQIKLPEPYTSANIYLIGPRLDLTLTRSVFFTSYFQYNSQYKNININSRFQWRFKPVSDLFIVYTDNYFYTFENTGVYSNFTPKNRAFVIKLTYWFSA
ncbi:MAG: carbohydrate binding family 9 domain-containing protein [Cyclobacteriaceae bacterium]|nr:carbohydrate binding family 9 domain-containing protein [Cyclobacteriaceae bacterium]